MNLADIITELENYELEIQDLRSSAVGLQASVMYFFEQVQNGKNWTTEQLLELRDKCQINKSLTLLEEALRPSEETEEQEEEL